MRAVRLPFSQLTTSLFAAGLLMAPAAALAQDPAAPAHIAFIDGSVLLEREGQAQPADGGVPFLPGDRLRTTTGRVEVLFPDGSALAIDEYALVDLQSPTLLRVTGGRIMLTVAGATDPAGAQRFQLDTPTASVSTDGPGEYRVALFSGPAGPETELAVLRGTASLTTERGSTPVRAGERSIARENEIPAFPQAFNSARFDAFDRWALARRDARLGTRSAQYLPRELHMYGGTFDRYGAWQHEAPYGQVWYPTVPVGWRPYYDGYWTSYRPYGWTWVGGGIWGWPTHHYGRWGYARSRWFWIPGRRWGPAWVSWASAPGYVSWCPLGFDGRPVFALSINVGNPWAGWVVMNRTHFGSRGYYANRYAVEPHRLPRSTPFVVQAGAPVAVPRAIPRNAGGRSRPIALPRDGSRGIAIPREGLSASSIPSYVIRGDQSSSRGAAPRAEARRPDDPRAIGGPSARDTMATGPSLSRERTFRQPLPDVRRASPRTPAAAAPAASTFAPGSPSIPSFDRRRDSRSEPAFGRPADPSGTRQAVPRWGSPAAEAPRRAMPSAGLPPAVPSGPPQAVPGDRMMRPDFGRAPTSREGSPRAIAPAGPSRSAPMAIPRSAAPPPPPATSAPPSRSAPSGGGSRSAGGGDGQRSSGGGGERQAPSSRSRSNR